MTMVKPIVVDLGKLDPSLIRQIVLDVRKNKPKVELKQAQ